MAKIENLCAEFKDSGLYTHVYVACGFLNGRENYFEHSLSDDGRDVYDLSSLTKAFVTTPLALWRCASVGRTARDVKLSRLFGDLALTEVGASRHDYSVADYLRHETGLPAWRNFYVDCLGRRQTLREALKACPEKHDLTEPAKDVYSDIGFLTLGNLLEASAGTKLLEEWRKLGERFAIGATSRLGAGFEFDRQRVISTGYCPVRQRTLIGEVHDENCWALDGFTGHAGLFGSGRDVTGYLRDLWQSKEGREIFTMNFREIGSGGDSLMGWRKGNDESARGFADGRGCGHLGFTGTAFWTDALTGSYAVVLTNRVISARISPAIKTFRARAFTDLWAMIQEAK